MRAWRKLHSKILESENVAALSDGAIVLLTFLIAAQDDSGYYPYSAPKLARLTATRPSWSRDVTVTLTQELVDQGIARWEDGGVILLNGVALNGIPRKDVEPELYPRQHEVDVLLTSRQHDVALEQSRVEQSREEKRRESATAPAVATPRKERPPLIKITEEDVENLIEKWAASFKDRTVIQEHIKDALSHKASDKWKDQKRYVDNWLRREAERHGKEMRNGRSIQPTPEDYDQQLAEKTRRMAAKDTPW